MRLRRFASILLVLSSTGLFSQIGGLDNNTIGGTTFPSDNSSTFESPKIDIKGDTPTSYELNNPLEEPEGIDIDKKSNLVDAGEALEKRWKDKEIKESYKKDQYLGDFNTKGSFLSIECRDHQYVDGDRVRVIVNDEVVDASITLGASYRGINIDLKPGFNKIDFLALNQGTSGPNTAQFRVFDSKGILISSNEWNLTTGVKATIIVVKE